MNNNESNGFSYTYSAKDREEIKRIREKYTEKDESEDKMERLRRLDLGATQRAQAWALVFGVIGALLLGSGMSLFMSELGSMIGLGAVQSLLIGIPMGLVGCVLASLAYPMYNLILKRQREKIAPEIIRLTDELMK